MRKREKIKTMSLYDLMAASAVTRQYRDYTNDCYKNAVDSLPDGYKNSSMDSGTRCDWSYNQGQRDAYLHIRNMLLNIGIDIECLVDTRSDEMYEECNRDVD
jgi:hypothetical protein